MNKELSYNKIAFPQHFVEAEYGGMTLREWLSGQALAGICSNTHISTDVLHVATNTPNIDMPQCYAKMAVNIADAVLAVLAKDK